MSEKITLIDGHAHLDLLDDLSGSLEEARESGVDGIIAVGMGIDSNRKILDIAGGNKKYVYPALGYHPWEMREEEIEKTLMFVRDHVSECVALGEIGLDYKIKLKKQLQWKAFEGLLGIASESNKPVIVHCRFSHRRALDMVKDAGVKRAVFHWYSGPLSLLGEILDAGYYISATPALAYSPPHQDAIKWAPIEKILLETDAPVSYQGREARPRDVRITMEEVARLKGLEPCVVSKQATANASRLFQITFPVNPT